MLPHKSNVYLETSSVNYLADKYTYVDAIATKVHHGLRGTRFFVSPITLWEILSTTDASRREQLIFYIQHLCHGDLLNTPSEFIINYISKGCPLIEKKYDFKSHTSLAATWSDICHNPAKTFIYDKKLFDHRTRNIRQGFKLASRYIESIKLGDKSTHPDVAARLGLDSLLKRLKGIDLSDHTPREIKRFKTSLILMLIVLCYGIDIDPTPVDQFWARIGITKVADRLAYLVTNHESLVYSGPFALMSETALSQLQTGGNPNRGILWDALHSLYLVYVDFLLTADQHFKRLRRNNRHPNFKKVIYLPNASVYAAKTIDVDVSSRRAF
jgi:hypothetical protein